MRKSYLKRIWLGIRMQSQLEKLIETLTPNSFLVFGICNVWNENLESLKDYFKIKNLVIMFYSASKLLIKVDRGIPTAFVFSWLVFPIVKHINTWIQVSCTLNYTSADLEVQIYLMIFLDKFWKSGHSTWFFGTKMCKNNTPLCIRKWRNWR